MTFTTTLLKQQFPELDGLQSTLLSQINAFRPVGSDRNSIQFHHTGQFHWDMSASVNGKIHLYDSKFSGGPLSSSLQVQLSLIYKTSIVEEENTKFICVDCPAVQQQLGSTDCGVFAVAFAYHAGTN